MQENMITRLFSNDDSLMKEIYKTENGSVVVGAWSRDVGTRECRLKLAIVYPDGEVSPIREYPKRKLADKKSLYDLADMDGIAVKEIEDIYKAVVEKAPQLKIQADSEGKSSLCEVYRTVRF